MDDTARCVVCWPSGSWTFIYLPKKQTGDVIERTGISWFLDTSSIPHCFNYFRQAIFFFLHKIWLLRKGHFYLVAWLLWNALVALMPYHATGQVGCIYRLSLRWSFLLLLLPFARRPFELDDFYHWRSSLITVSVLFFLSELRNGNRSNSLVHKPCQAGYSPVAIGTESFVWPELIVNFIFKKEILYASSRCRATTSDCNL